MRSGFVRFELLPTSKCGRIVKIVGCEHISDSEAMVQKLSKVHI
jgi:hypothetical protein